MALILASASPRRKEILETLGAKNMKILPARGEEAPCEGLSPEETVKALAKAKAEEVSALAEAGDTVIAADTIVCLDGKKLGKPHSEAEAAEMLCALSGRTHEVFTGIAVHHGGNIHLACERTAVRFKSLTDAEIAAYIATGEPMDKAGAYGIQGRAGLFVEGIEGDYFNVVGLPVCTLGKLLSSLGVEAWN